MSTFEFTVASTIVTILLYILVMSIYYRIRDKKETKELAKVAEEDINKEVFGELAQSLNKMNTVLSELSGNFSNMSKGMTELGQSLNSNLSDEDKDKIRNTNIINEAIEDGRSVDYHGGLYIVYLKNKRSLVLKETEVNVDDIRDGVRIHPTISPDWWNEEDEEDY